MADDATEDSPVDAVSGPDAPEYTFEGYEVDFSDLVALTPPGFATLGGSASTFYAALCAGVAGGILALAALLPDACVRLFDLARNGQQAEARQLQRQLLPLARLVSTGYGVPGLKAALLLSGVDAGFPRLPLAPAPEAAVSALKQALNTFEEAFA